MENSEKIPTTVLKRLPIYLHFVKYMYPDNNDYVSSAIIAKALNLGEVQVRKDLGAVSGAGRPKTGYPVEQLIQTVRRYQETTGRRVSFEYSMVRGVNDSDVCAKQLADLIRGMGAHVNLIPINPVDGSPYSATDAANVRRFQQKLESLGVNATVRRRLGSEISAACGQLRRDEMNGKA